MKSTEAKEVVAGGIAVLVLMALMGLFYSGQALKAGAGLTEYRLFATFNRIDGLSAGADILLSGIEVGKVEKIELDDEYRARVTFRINGGVELPADTATAIHTDGLFGSKFVVLDPGGDETILTDGGVITYTQDAIVVSDLLDLIIAEGKAQRRQAETGQN